MKSLRLTNCRIFSQLSTKRQTRIVPVASKYIHSDGGTNGSQSRRYTLYAATFGVVSLATTIAAYKRVQAFNRNDKNKYQSQHIYTRKDVQDHNSLDKGVWITWKGNVYDITDFIHHHPGGSHTIMMGAGGDVEPFWMTYTFHETEEVQKLLSTYRIGVLSAEEQHQEVAREFVKLEGPYANDPLRNPILEVHTSEPFNAETPSKLLADSFITPTEIFFVRNHLPVPEVDLKEYTLEICIGTDGDPDSQKNLASFTLEDLKTKFKAHTINCVIQCSGNRRNDLKKIKEIKGLGWKVGAMGNASWTGVRLVDLLDSLNLKPNESFKHVQIEGLDCDMSGQSYGASISADIAFDPNKDVLLAYEMNGQPLTRDHGFPLRFVAPGITGARNVKWLSKIILSHEESNSHWQRNDYKSFSPNVDMFNLDYKSSLSIQEMPVQSAICQPIDGEELKLDSKTQKLTIPVKGYAYSGGGKTVIRVDVSNDGGSTWHTANLEDLLKNSDGTPDFSNRNQKWSWTRWSIDIPIPEKIIQDKSGSIEILCRAFDSAYNSQPERAETIWNVRGVVNNSWHRVRYNVKINE